MELMNPTVIVGHYGSGKTEFTANLAIQLKERQNRSVVVADLDIVNPYFRIRELTESLAEQGIRLLSSNYEEDYYLDMPALAAAIQTCFEGEDQLNLIDVGGDPAGATVLARYSHLLRGRDYAMWMVVNANRPQTATVEDIRQFIAGIEQTSRLKINGVINNTHLLQETSIEDILRGDALIRQVSKETGLPVICTVVEERLREATAQLDLAGELFYIKIAVRPDWL